MRFLLSYCWVIGLVGLFSGTPTLYAQEGYDFKLLQTLNRAVSRLEVDELKNVYLLEDEYHLTKCDAKGKPLYSFNENTLGSISYVDVRNPFRILVYYDDYATVVFLDRTLSELQRYDLSRLDLPQVQALGTASDNHIWIFDNETYTLKKVDQADRILTESLELNLLFSQALTPIRLFEANNKVYLQDKQEGLLVFDLFGSYDKTIPLPEDIDYVQWQDGKLFYTKKNTLYAYHPTSFLTQTIALPILKTGVQQVCVAQELLYIRYEDRVELFRLRKK